MIQRRDRMQPRTIMVYVTATGRRVVVVHVFTKKTQKTPRREIETALRRAQEVR